ncbi:unnamed protein product [Heterobilharzia americana]|nr:unnamed protein product [Heterobilharzia americana]
MTVSIYTSLFVFLCSVTFCYVLYIQYNFPIDRRPRLLVRRAQSLYLLGRNKEALEEYDNCLELIKSESITIHNSMNEAIRIGREKCMNSEKNEGKEKKDVLNNTSSIPFFVHEAKTLTIKNYNNKDKTKNIHVTSAGGNKNDENCNLHPRIFYPLNVQNPPAVILNWNEEFGWHIVAARTIEPGELLIRDTPYSCRLQSDRLLFNCYRCSKRCINLIPCRNCTQVGFCSEACEQAAWDPVWSLDTISPISNLSLPWHCFECGLVDRLTLEDYAGWKRLRNTSLSTGLTASMKKWKVFIDKLSDDDIIGGPNISWLAFALLARTSPTTLNRLVKTSLNKLACKVGSKQDDGLLSFTGRRVVPQSDWDDYTSIGWLATNSDKRKTGDLWQRCVAAVYLTLCLEAGGYPIQREENVLENDQPTSTSLPFIWASTCMLHHLQCISSNGHSLSVPEYILSENAGIRPTIPGIDLNKLSSVEISTCLYPVLSLINHSCDPNVTNVTESEFRCAVYSLRPIKCGEMIYGNYGLHYAVHSLKERQNSLWSQYHFHCKCQACLDDWSAMNNSKSIIGDGIMNFQLKCFTCSGAIVSNVAAPFLNQESNLTKIGKQCHCSQHIQMKSIGRFQKLLFNDLLTKLDSIPLTFQKTPPKEITDKFLSKFFTYATRMLNTKHLYGVLRRPCIHLDWLQELLKQLFDLQHTSWSYESEIIRSTF